MVSGISGMSFYSVRPFGYSKFLVGTRAASGANPNASAEKTASVGKILPGQAEAAPGIEKREMAMARAGIPAARQSETLPGQAETQADQGLFFRKGVDPAEYAVRMRIQYLDPDADPDSSSVSETKSAWEAAEEGKCQTCEERKYQDGSNDMGVSFKTPTRIAPEAAASAVRSHEQEHVVREQAKAEREGRRVVSQNVTLHTEICPECGRVYISGGTTRTTTAAAPERANGIGQEAVGIERRPFSAVA